MYKVLVLGTKRAAIDDIFRQLGNTFELLSSSVRSEDVMAHIKYVKPDAIIYSLKNEAKEDMSRTVLIKDRIKDSIPFIVFGGEEDCHNFRQAAPNIADGILVKPISTLRVKNRITDLMEEKNPTSIFHKTDSKAEPWSGMPDMSEDSELMSILKSIEETSGDIEIPRRHILIVDDDVQMLKTIKRLLEDTYDIATAINGEVALRFLSKKHTDLVLLDCEMPEMKGPEVLEQIRSNRDTKNIPVIFLTGIADRDKIQQALALNPQGYILKPTDKKTLREKISAVLG